MDHSKNHGRLTLDEHPPKSGKPQADGDDRTGHVAHGAQSETRKEHRGHTESQRKGYRPHYAHMMEDFRRRFWISLVLTIPVLALSPDFLGFFGIERIFTFPGDQYVLFVLASVIYLYGGWPFIKGMYDELHNRLPGMMTLVAVAITSAYAYSTAVVFGLPGVGLYWELVTLIDIMLLGHWQEMRAVSRTSSALEELAKLLPKEAHRLQDGGEAEDIPIGELQKGDRVLVKPAEKFPVDGSITEGETTVNESMITGESKPVTKKPGDMVVAGSVNGEGSVTVTVEKTGEDSFLSQVAKLVKQAEESKSRMQDLANKAAVVLVVIALVGGAATFIAWLGLLNRDMAFSVERAVTVMLIACPHALGLAIPLVVAVSSGIAARNGFIIRERIAFERARNIGAIIFDKTGTLTLGQFGVSDVIPLDKEWNAEQITRIAASVESRSEHPIAQGIVSAAKEYPPAEEFKSIPGKGAQARVESRMVMVVSPGYLEANGIAAPREKVDALTAQGKTVVFVLIENKPIGAVALDDIIRQGSKDAVARLKAMGISPMMLTGDNRHVAERVAREIGIDEFFAEVLPEHKADKVKEVQKRGIVVAMVGDGVNDAPALAQADVGIAIGAGTDVAMETSGVVLVRDNPLDVVTIIALSKATYRKMVQNLGWATGYNVVAIPLAAGVLYGAGILLTPAIAAIFMSASTIIVAINAKSLHLRRIE